MSLTSLATQMIQTLGYGGMAIGLVVDSAGVPIPSEVILPLAGAVARQGHMSLLAVIAVGTIAQTAGAVLAYYVGATGGLAIVKKYGKYVLFSEHELHKTQKLFEKYGQWLTLAGRCMPGVRTYIGFPAGIARMNFASFLTASFIGSFGWTIILSCLGYFLSDQLHLIDSVLNKFGMFFAILSVVVLIWYLRRQSKRDKA